MVRSPMGEKFSTSIWVSADPAALEIRVAVDFQQKFRCRKWKTVFGTLRFTIGHVQLAG